MGIFFRKIWEEYGRFWHFPGKSWKNYGKYGRFSTIFPRFFSRFSTVKMWFLKKYKKRSSKFQVNPMPSENDLDDTEN